MQLNYQPITNFITNLITQSSTTINHSVQPSRFLLFPDKVLKTFLQKKRRIRPCRFFIYPPPPPTRPNPGTITTNFVTSIFVKSTQKFAVFFPLPSWTQLFEGGLVLTQGKILILFLFLLLKSISRDNFFIYYFWSIN